MKNSVGASIKAVFKLALIL